MEEFAQISNFHSEHLFSTQSPDNSSYAPGSLTKLTNQLQQWPSKNYVIY